MTRAQGSGSELEIRSFGAAGAARTVLVLRTGPVATTDPDPSVTAAHEARIVAIELDDAELDDPPTFGGETPAESAVHSLAVLARREGGDRPVGLVAERSAAPLALALAAHYAPLIDRLALVSVPSPASPLAADLLAETMTAITADTLLVDVPEHGADMLEWCAAHLPSARVSREDVAAAALIDTRLGLAEVWERVLAHVAPRPERG